MTARRGTLDDDHREGTSAVENATGIATLLTETEAAHGVYEATELGGVYDLEWPAWYARYAVEHGIGDLVGHAVSADYLAEFLAREFDDYRTADPRPDDSWAAWMANRIATELEARA